MSLALPSYIERAGIIDAPIAHKWDDSDPEVAYLVEDERLQHRIGQTSDRGVMALSVGFAEWVAWRFSRFTDDPTLFHRIEAVWAASIDWRYLKVWAPDNRKNWAGSVRGPLWGASDMLRRVVDLTVREQFAFPESVCLSYLVLHVVPDHKTFKDWRRFAIGRLAKFHRCDLANVLGDPVPREILDPDYDYSPEQTRELLANFLKGLNPTTNPYLRSPEEIIQLGYDGTPYSL